MVPWEMGRGVVEFPDGRRIRGRCLMRSAPDGPAPEYGLYLYIRDPGPFHCPYTWLPHGSKPHRNRHGRVGSAGRGGHTG